MASYGSLPPSTATSQAQSRAGASPLSGKAGLQKTQRSGVEVTLYPLVNAGVKIADATDGSTVSSDLGGTLKFGKLELTGHKQNDDAPSIVSVTTQNSIASGGTFTIALKLGNHAPLVGFLSDNSWVDITYTCNGLKWHVMRGLVDEVRVQQSVTGSGAYVKTFTVIGRSFQKCWADTSFYFNPTITENVAANGAVLALTNGASTSPDKAINIALRQILYTMTKLYERNPWTMPSQMPNVGAPINGQKQTQFSDIFNLDDSLFNVYALPGTMPANTIVSTMGSGDLWSIAREFSDPMYCELFTEQITPGDVKGNYDADGTKGTPIARDPANPDIEPTQMSVILRDKPFLTVDPILFDGKGNADNIKAGPYFQLPQFTLNRQTIAASDLGVSGYERYNAFFAAPPIGPESGGNFPLYAAPLWNVEEMKYHGFRRLDVTSKFDPNFVKLNEIGVTLPSYQAKKRALTRDWYCQGAQLLNGTLTLGCGAPQLRVGCRLKIPPHSAADQESNFYIEQVTHNWSVTQGTRTQVSVSRGWIGTENDWITALQDVVKNYQTNYSRKASDTDVGTTNATT